MQSRTCLPVRPDQAKNAQARSREAAAAEGMRSHRAQVQSQVSASVGTSPCPNSEDLEIKTPGALQSRAFLTSFSFPWAGFWCILHQSFRKSFYSARAAGKSSNTGMILPLHQPSAQPGAPFAQREHWSGKSFHRAAHAGLGPWPPSVSSKPKSSRSHSAA